MEINWDELRQQMMDATAGINPENLTISVETFTNVLG